MTQEITAQTVKTWLDDGTELAFIDVREHGQYGEAHPFFVSSVPYSRLEYLLPARVPNLSVRMVLMDNGDGVAQRAMQRAQALGYTNVFVMAGGAPAWADSGYTLYAGVNVPSKAFAEVMELARHTPSMTAEAVFQLQQSGAAHIILDGRPLTEFRKMSIPGGWCCPNGELALRVQQMVDDEETTIIVNCAGRTRSIIGAQTLIDAGIKNPVYALENGTQGWVLAGLERAHGVTGQYPEKFDLTALEQRQQTVSERADSVGVTRIDGSTLAHWLRDDSRTTYLLDVRTPEEFARDGSPLSQHAPGGQLVQGTDEWIGVRGARIVLVDSDGVRAPMTAYWLSQIGHEVHVLDGGVDALHQLESEGSDRQVASLPATSLPSVSAESVANAGVPEKQLVDLRPAMTYRKGHIEGARWSIRPVINTLALDASRPVVLIGDRDVCELVAADLGEQGFADMVHLSPDESAWQAAGLATVATPDNPADDCCIDHLFFTAERHTGNLDHSRQYLDWELNLVKQLDEQERGAYRLKI